MLDDHWFRPTHRRGRCFASFRWSGLAPECSYRVAGRAGGITAVQALGGRTGTVARVPDGGMSQLYPGPFTGATRPPIGRTRLVMAPNDEVVVVPIKVVVEPGAYCEAEAKRDERAPEGSLEIDHVRLIYWHVDE